MRPPPSNAQALLPAQRVSSSGLFDILTPNVPCPQSDPLERPFLLPLTSSCGFWSKLLYATALLLSRLPALAIARNGATMRSSQIIFLAFVVLAVTGCGTFYNLEDSPKGPLFVGTGCCYPFGGVTRSGLLAVMGPPAGLAGVVSGNMAISQGEFGDGFQQIGQGLFLTSAGLIAIADTPLSLAGDILTFPIAYARSKEYSWATWWGEKSMSISDSAPAPASDGIEKKIDSAGKPD
jgi:hypothetical protein